MRLCYFFVERETRYRGVPECDAGEDSENSPYWKNIVEMRDNVIGVMQSDVECPIGENDAGEPPHSK